jgi:hypothetical protein
LKRVASVLFAAALSLGAAGCASPPRDSSEREPTVVVRGGVPVRVTGFDAEGAHAFATEDGIHWRRVEAGEAPVSEERPGDEPLFRVTRELDSDESARGRWHVWRREGISWRQVATLPDDAGLGF